MIHKQLGHRFSTSVPVETSLASHERGPLGTGCPGLVSAPRKTVKSSMIFENDNAHPYPGQKCGRNELRSNQGISLDIRGSIFCL